MYGTGSYVHRQRCLMGSAGVNITFHGHFIVGICVHVNRREIRRIRVILDPRKSIYLLEIAPWKGPKPKSGTPFNATVWLGVPTSNFVDIGRPMKNGYLPHCIRFNIFFKP